jgi:hypothetical protein
MPNFARSVEEEFNLPVGSYINSQKGVLEPREAVQQIFSIEDAIFEKRVQAIVFAAELEWIATKDDAEVPRLTSATYKRAPRGVYSADIRRAITTIEGLYSRVAYSKGHRTRKWDTSRVSNPPMSLEDDTGEDDDHDCRQDALQIIDKVYEAASGVSDEALMDWCLSIDDISALDTGEEIDLEYVSSYL